jgi:hypothetical protein
MGLAEIQTAMARLYVDRALRERFFDKPAAVGAELGLESSEARGLACVSQRQVEEYAASLRNKRRDQVRRRIPLAAQALGWQFAGLFDDYAQQSKPRGSRADLDDAVAFVNTLSPDDETIEPKWVVDLARYEIAWHLAARLRPGWLVRIFRYPVARRPLAETITPQETLALWWRLTRRGRLRHLVIAMPKFIGRLP